ncbi:MAG TPA: hypothetical protein VGO93_26630 [Candidatus Xenobia bacterium]|jgi:hypothetical protein
MAQISGFGNLPEYLPPTTSTAGGAGQILPRSGWQENPQGLEMELEMVLMLLMEQEMQSGGFPFGGFGGCDPTPTNPSPPVVQPMYGVAVNPGGTPTGGGTPPVIQPMYGVTVNPGGTLGSGGTTPVIQPMYGVAVNPGGPIHPPPLQAMYGVIMA